MAAGRKSVSARSLLGGKMSNQLVKQRATADKGKQKFWLSHIDFEAPLVKHPPHLTRQGATQQRSGLT